MRPLAGAVGRFLRAIGIEDDVARTTALDAWTAAATSVIGSDAARTSAVRVEADTLVVAVPTAQWAVEIRLRERELLARLAELAPRARIRRVRSVPQASSAP